MKDPESLSGRFAQEAVRRVHTEDGVSPEARLQVHPDPKVPGANYVDAGSDSRYWVGLQGEVVRTADTAPPPHPSPQFARARSRYTSAVERVRLRYAVPVSVDLFAVPDTHVPDAFFVHDTEPEQTVRWVAPDGSVHDGYQVVDGAPRWEDVTVAARREALASAPSTAPLADG